MQILNGNTTAATIRAEIKAQVEVLKANGRRSPHLAAILVGNDGASQTYVNSKAKDCEEVGFDSTVIRMDSTISETELLDTISAINNNPVIDGLIVQLPLPKHISAGKVTDHIFPEKDVDGFHTVNTGKMTKGVDAYLPATPYGILQLLERYNVPTEGKHCVVIGRSDIVGKPAAILMARNTYPGNCTVTMCHSKTQNLETFTRMADILIVALGKPEFLTADMIKEGAVVIDVGITRVDDATSPKGYRLKGDVHYESVAPKSGFITPVPGGVGPMTRVGLLQNTLKAYLQNQK